MPQEDEQKPQVSVTFADGKVSENYSSWKKKWYGSLLLIAAIALALIVFVAPVLSGVIAAAQNKDLINFCGKLFQTFPLNLWSCVTAYDNWFLPSLLVVVCIVVFCAGIAIYFREEYKLKERKNAPNIYGPDAKLTNTKGSAIISDPKLELYYYSGLYVRSLGISTFCFDFQKSDLTYSIDPLKPIKDVFCAEKKVYDEEVACAYLIACVCSTIR